MVRRWIARAFQAIGDFLEIVELSRVVLLILLINTRFPLVAELVVVIRALKLAWDKLQFNLWIKSDSTFIINPLGFP